MVGGDGDGDGDGVNSRHVSVLVRRGFGYRKGMINEDQGTKAKL